SISSCIAYVNHLLVRPSPNKEDLMISFSKLTARALAFMFVLPLALILLLPARAVMAQEVTGSLKGVVVDANGAVVPGATFNARSQEKGDEHAATTDNDGNFAIPKLTPGKYT